MWYSNRQQYVNNYINNVNEAGNSPKFISTNIMITEDKYYEKFVYKKKGKEIHVEIYKYDSKIILYVYDIAGKSIINY